MSSVRGRGRNLEITVDRALPAAAEELRALFLERPDFYRGSHAVANLGILEPERAELTAFRDLLAAFGITLDGLSGSDVLAPVLAELELAYLGVAPVAEVSALPRARPARAAELSDSARSLVADFAGARADLARRRLPGSFNPPGAVATAGVTIPPPPLDAPAGVSTLYHRGTMRGGQTLHNMGNIVIVGDVNPGAELIASGDIVVFGSLRGVAHAGAQGDRTARVLALELAPTQLRIATVIGASADDPRAGRGAGPQQAAIDGDRIAIGPLGAFDVRREVTL